MGLERLTLGGAAMDLPMAISHLATAITRQPAQQIRVDSPVTLTVPERSVEVHQPIHVSVPQTSVEVHQPITLQASIDATRSVTKTIVTQRQDDGTLIATVKEE